MTRSFGQARRVASTLPDFSRRQVLLPKFTSHDPEALHTLEDVVGKASRVEQGLRELRKFEHNTPSFEPERRRFLKFAAVLAGLATMEGCASLEYKGQVYEKWMEDLMAGDPIYGPGLLFELGCERDFQCHMKDPSPYYGVDYKVQIGTPIVPALAGLPWFVNDMYGGNRLGINTFWGPTKESVKDRVIAIQYKHLSGINEQILNKDTQMNKVTALSGNSGISRSRGQPLKAHLHFQVNLYDPKTKQYTEIFDPFTFGPEGGRPVYWDTKVRIWRPYADERKEGLEFFLDSLQPELAYSQIDTSTKKELLDLRTNPMELRNYVGRKVLKKNPITDKYDFLPGSDMYSLMLQVNSLLRTNAMDLLIMLPFPHPYYAPYYRHINWESSIKI